MMVTGGPVVVTGGGTRVAVTVTGGAVVTAVTGTVTVVGLVTVLVVELIVVSVWVTGTVLVIVGGVSVTVAREQDNETSPNIRVATRQALTSVIFSLIVFACIPYLIIISRDILSSKNAAGSRVIRTLMQFVRPRPADD